ncbi:MAG TPA: hypothetical protein VGV37_01960 [Aliidongia sp.]|uniref:hypothetical protein n=1 Tax=Aliidongia sp. TaxID=1914230 RepID=UPI002DDDA95A|nr:hypothetical protein [Aliidongia sp.]HEV2673276.1 hypothetical protein [Aliidongia sp.]
MSAVKLRLLSLGAGVQSSTLALMAARGETDEMPDGAIFADAGWEPDAVYRQVDWLESVLPFPVHRVSVGNLREDIEAQAADPRRRIAAVPWFTLSPSGKRGMGRRQCTKEYKLTPIRRKVRELLGGKTPKGAVEMWIGISTDEAWRVKPSQVGYIINRHVLIEKRMSRQGCVRWLAERQYRLAPKSACKGCPYHDDTMWRDMKINDPSSFSDAVVADRLIRNGGSNMRSQQFMHRSCKPLDQVDFSNLEDLGQLNLFNNECEGMCGV